MRPRYPEAETIRAERHTPEGSFHYTDTDLERLVRNTNRHLQSMRLAPNGPGAAPRMDQGPVPGPPGNSPGGAQLEPGPDQLQQSIGPGQMDPDSGPSPHPVRSEGMTQDVVMSGLCHRVVAQTGGYGTGQKRLSFSVLREALH